MAGRGPAPGANPAAKPEGRRARRGSSGPVMRVVEAEPVPQPDLPDVEWPARTLEWWSMWGESPLSAEFTSTDWSELMDTALLHAAYWSGDLKVAGELRLRVAKFGATPEDRARLRIQFATADRAESAAPKSVPASRDRYGPLQSVV